MLMGSVKIDLAKTLQAQSDNFLFEQSRNLGFCLFCYSLLIANNFTPTLL
jgi:hypothetical protein